jgi:putative transposase
VVTIIKAVLSFLRALFLSRASLALEVAALRQQLWVFQRQCKRPRLTHTDRAFWMLLRRRWGGWKRVLFIVRPATVIGWGREGFRIFWRRKSKPGRPRIPRRHINFIRRISSDHPEWGEDKIAEELAAKFGIKHSGSTIRRYMGPRSQAPHGGQTWRTFIKNHARQIWACDFLAQHTAYFSVVYVFVIMEIESRRIVHWSVTTSPTLPWVKQQIREATPWGETPRFLLHDNDGIFGQYSQRPTVAREDGKKRTYRCRLDLWLDSVMGIEGVAIPYGAPNANAHLERFNRTLREDALNHFVFFGVRHIRHVIAEFIAYYNGARPSQAIHGIPQPYPELKEPPVANGRLVARPVLGGLHHDYRLAA